MVVPSQGSVLVKKHFFTPIMLTMCLKTTHNLIRNHRLLATNLSTWWKALGWWILCSLPKTPESCLKKGSSEAPQWQPELKWRLRRQHMAPPLMHDIWWLCHQISNSINKKQLVCCEPYYSCTVKRIISCRIIAKPYWDRDLSVHVCFLGTSGHL